MSNTERRLQEVEERLASFEAPPPPEGLLDSIQAEIPDDLGVAPDTRERDGMNLHRWRLLAASLAVVAIGGLLGYKLMTEGPTPGATVVESARSGPVAEIGEGPDGEVPAEIPDTVGEEPVVGQDPAQGIETSSVAPGQSIADERAGQLRVAVKDKDGASLPGTTVTLRGDRSSEVVVTDAEGKAEFGDLQPGEYGLGAELEGFDAAERPRLEVGEAITEVGVVLEPSADVLTVTSESPLLAAPEPPSSTHQDVDAGNRRLETLRAEAEALRSQLKRLPRASASRFDREVAGESAGDRPGGSGGYVSRIGPRAPVPPSTGGTVEPNDRPYGDMFFQAYGTNPFVDTEDDPQSTFGVDVDTASYTMTRSYLRRGSLPPSDAIRVEEFVNFFDYGDRAPRTRDFAVVAEGGPSPFASTARTYLLRFALKGREVEDSRRKPAVLTFVVDISGSMNRENRLGLVQRALRLLVEQLDEGDAIGLVVYGSHGEVILEPTSEHARVLSAIERLRPGGSTNAEEGLALAYETARRFFRRDAINRVILCSDGVANVGNTGPQSILRRIGDEAEAGIELTTVGFGMGNYNDVLMEQLADRGDGNYAYVDDLDEARRVFVENLTGTLQTIAGDAKVQVEFDPRTVQSYRLLGYENRAIADRDFRNDAIDAGEIGAGHQASALYEIKLSGEAPRHGAVATLRLRYRSQRTGRMVEDAVELNRPDLAESWSRASRGLQLAAIVAEFAEVLKASYWASGSDLGDLADRAGRLARTGDWGAEVGELADLIATAAKLERGVHPIDDGEGFER